MLIDPRTEVALIASALIAPAADVTAIAHHVLDDLTMPGTRQVLEIVCDLIAARRPHTAIAVADELQRRGMLAGHTGQQVKMVLTEASSAGLLANPLALSTYAAAVSSEAYRHRFAEIGKALVEAASDAPECDLLPMLRQAGTDAVQHAKRLTALRGEEVTN